MQGSVGCEREAAVDLYARILDTIDRQQVCAVIAPGVRVASRYGGVIEVGGCQRMPLKRCQRVTAARPCSLVMDVLVVLRCCCACSVDGVAVATHACSFQLCNTCNSFRVSCCGHNID